MSIARVISVSSLFVLLTLVSQIGGLVYIVWWLFIQKHIKLRSGFWTRTARFASFIALHSICSLLIVPHFAPVFGREALPISSDKLTCSNLVNVICCRNYVRTGITEELNNITDRARILAQNKEVKLVYLDACFPFGDGFPLLPHLSHSTGNEVDLAFCYTQSGEYLAGEIPNYIGYGMFEDPNAGEFDQTRVCYENGYWQYGLLEAIAIDWNPGMQMDDEITKAVGQACVESSMIRRIFLEPHLKSRWNLGDKVRFHGCHAVRHDDHFHLDFDK